MIGGTPFVPTGSEGYGAQGGSKAPRSIARRHRSHAQPALAGEHGEEPPFDATEHRSSPSFRGRLTKNFDYPHDQRGNGCGN